MSAAAEEQVSWETTTGFSSSNISELRYDKSTDTLQIDFSSGETYAYYSVPPATHRGFQTAPSKGEFFARHIRGRFSYERVS